MYLRKHGPLDRTKLDQRVYFRKSVFESALYDRSEHSGSSDLGHIKHYDILKHAEDRLSSAKSDLDRIDCIGNIKRAIDFRLQKLWSDYDLQSLCRSKNERKLDVLVRLGLARQLVIRDIIEIRNAVEHHETTAIPTQAVLERYIDIAWYFLRSTDWIFANGWVTFVVSGPWKGSSPAAIDGMLKIAPEQGWRLEFYGSIRNDMLLLQPDRDCFGFYTAQDIGALIKAQDPSTESLIDLDRGLIDDPAALEFFGKRYFDLTAEML